jgi:hypothetical protein
MSVVAAYPCLLTALFFRENVSLLWISLADRVFQKELYNFESLYGFIQRACTVF